MTISFNDKVAIVTGAGGGLGRCHALEFAKRGAKVVVNDLGGSVDGTGGSSEAADKVVDEIKAMGGEAISNGSSVTDKAGVKKLVDDTMAAFGRVDILVNNAGVLRDKSFAKVTLDDFEFVVNVHMMGSVYCTKAVWPNCFCTINRTHHMNVYYKFEIIKCYFCKRLVSQNTCIIY